MAITLLINGMTLRQIDETNLVAEQEKETREAIAALRSVSEHLIGAESDMRGFVVTGRDEYLTFYEYATGSTGKQALTDAQRIAPAQGMLMENIGTLRATLSRTPAQRQRLELLEHRIHDKVDHMHRVIRTAWVRSLLDAQMMVQSREGKRIMDDIKHLIGLMMKEEQGLLDLRTEQMQAESLRKGRWMIATSLLAALAGIVAIAAVYTGKSRCQRIENKLRQSQSFRNAILDSSYYAIIAIDTEGIIRLYSPAAARLFGYGSDEIVDKESIRLFHDKDESDLRAKELSKELDEEVGSDFEVYVKKASLMGWEEREWIYKRKNGTLFPGMLTVTPIYDERGHITGYLCIIRDDTERKQIDSMRNELIVMVSHAFAAPLKLLTSNLKVLADQSAGELPEKAHRIAADAYGHSQWLASVIDDLLEIERIEIGQVRFEKSLIDVDEWLQTLMDEHQPLAEYHKVRLAFRPDAKGTVMAGDRKRLSKAVSGLIQNAIKFSPEDQKVVVSSEFTDQGIRISVVDNGPGIPESFKSRLFSKFSYGDDAISRQHGGLGLGLNLARLVVEAHGGVIRFDSAPGRTIFSIILPESKMEPGE